MRSRPGFAQFVHVHHPLSAAMLKASAADLDALTKRKQGTRAPDDLARATFKVFCCTEAEALGTMMGLPAFFEDRRMFYCTLRVVSHSECLDVQSGLFLLQLSDGMEYINAILRMRTDNLQQNAWQHVFVSEGPRLGEPWKLAVFPQRYGMLSGNCNIVTATTVTH